MNLAYEFTPDEKRVVMKAAAAYEQVLRVIGDIHSITGNMAVAPDFSGFMAAPAPVPMKSAAAAAGFDGWEPVLQEKGA